MNTYQLSGAASFEVDLWSRLAKASKAAWEDILQEEENRRTLAQTVVAEAISLYLEMEAVERRLQIAAQSIEAFRLSLQFVETRYQRGLDVCPGRHGRPGAFWPRRKPWSLNWSRKWESFNNNCPCCKDAIHKPGRRVDSRKIITNVWRRCRRGCPPIC